MEWPSRYSWTLLCMCLHVPVCACVCVFTWAASNHRSLTVLMCWCLRSGVSIITWFFTHLIAGNINDSGDDVINVSQQLQHNWWCHQLLGSSTGSHGLCCVESWVYRWRFISGSWVKVPLHSVYNFSAVCFHCLDQYCADGRSNQFIIF